MNLNFQDSDYFSHSAMGNVIFRGSFRNQIIAVKRIVDCPFTLVNSDLLEKVKHQNIARHFFTEVKTEFIYIGMELMYGTMAQFFKAEKFAVARSIHSIKNYKSMMKQITLAIQFLHKKKIVHGNIKPQNIGLAKCEKKNKFIIKIMDSAEYYNDPCTKNYMNYNPNNPLCYRAPELFPNLANKNPSNDIYSLGVLFHYMLSFGKIPFAIQIYPYIRIIFTKVPLVIEVNNDKVCAEKLISKMIENEVANRLTMKQVLCDYFFICKEH